VTLLVVWVVVLMLACVPDGVTLYVSADDVVLAALVQSQFLFLCPRPKKRKRKASI
jgi:hypothetical protein